MEEPGNPILALRDGTLTAAQADFDFQGYFSIFAARLKNRDDGGVAQAVRAQDS